MSWPFNVSVEEPEDEKYTQAQICEAYGCTNLAGIYFSHCNEHLADIENLGLATDWIFEPELEAVDWENRS